jgi:hypothetical protein
MDRRLNHLEGEIRELRDLNNKFLWLLGTQMSMWVITHLPKPQRKGRPITRQSKGS